MILGVVRDVDSMVRGEEVVVCCVEGCSRRVEGRDLGLEGCG